MKKLDNVKAGESPTLLHESKANEVINAINAVLGITVSPPSAGRFEFKEGRSALILHPSKTGAQKAAEGIHPFKGYKSKYNGIGSPPSNQALRFRVHPGSVSLGATTLLPTNRNGEFLAPAGNSDGYFCWLECRVTAPTGEAAILTTAFYDFGTALPEVEPGDPETGAPPPKVYIPLFYVTTTADGIDGFVQLKRDSITLALEVQEITCEAKIRSISIR